MKRLMEEILHHLVWKKRVNNGINYQPQLVSSPDVWTISFSAIMKQFGMFHLSHLRRKKRGSHPIPRSTTPAGPGFQRLPRKPGLQNWDPQAWIENDLHLRKPEMASVEQKEPLHPGRWTAGSPTAITHLERKMIWTKPTSLWSMLIFQGVITFHISMFNTVNGFRNPANETSWGL